MGKPPANEPSGWRQAQTTIGVKCHLPRVFRPIDLGLRLVLQRTSVLYSATSAQTLSPASVEEEVQQLIVSMATRSGQGQLGLN